MRTLATLAFATVASAVAMPAAAQSDCPAELEHLRAEIEDDQALNMLWRSGLQNEMRTLYQTASSLSDNGNDSTCLEIAAVMQSILMDMNEPGGVSELGVWQEERLASLEEAVPADERSSKLRIEQILESNLRNMQDEYLGDVEDVVLGDQGVRYVVISRGGFLGMGEEQVAVPWDKLRVTEGEPILVLDVEPEALEEAPSFQAGSYADLDQAAFSEENDAYYDEVVAN